MIATICTVLHGVAKKVNGIWQAVSFCERSHCNRQYVNSIVREPRFSQTREIHARRAFNFNMLLIALQHHRLCTDFKMSLNFLLQDHKQPSDNISLSPSIEPFSVVLKEGYARNNG